MSKLLRNNLNVKTKTLLLTKFTLRHCFQAAKIESLATHPHTKMGDCHVCNSGPCIRSNWNCNHFHIQRCCRGDSAVWWCVRWTHQCMFHHGQHRPRHGGASVLLLSTHKLLPKPSAIREVPQRCSTEGDWWFGTRRLRWLLASGYKWSTRSRKLGCKAIPLWSNRQQFFQWYVPRPFHYS